MLNFPRSQMSGTENVDYNELEKSANPMDRVRADESESCASSATCSTAAQMF